MRQLRLKPSSRLSWWAWFLGCILLLPVALFAPLAMSAWWPQLIWAGFGLVLFAFFASCYLVLVTRLPVALRVLFALLILLAMVLCFMPRPSCASEQPAATDGCG